MPRKFAYPWRTDCKIPWDSSLGTDRKIPWDSRLGLSTAVSSFKFRALNRGPDKPQPQPTSPQRRRCHSADLLGHNIGRPLVDKLPKSMRKTLIQLGALSFILTRRFSHCLAFSMSASSKVSDKKCNAHQHG